MRSLQHKLITVLMAMLSFGGSALCAHEREAEGFTHVNLVSDIDGVARRADFNLVNPWGIAITSNGRIWVSDNATGVATIYSPDGMLLPLVVTIPPPSGSPEGTIAAPTGVILNQTSDFAVSGNSTSGPSVFIFATEDGTVAGWSPVVDRSAAVVVVDNSGSEAIYKGIALVHTMSGSNFLYVANFHGGVVEMYDTQFHFVRSFTDESLPEIGRASC